MFNSDTEVARDVYALVLPLYQHNSSTSTIQSKSETSGFIPYVA